MIARPVSTRPRQTGATAVLVAAVVAAVGMGLLSAVSPTLAIGGLVAVVAVPAAIARPKVLAYALAAAVPAESLVVGGVAIGRLLGPIAVIAIVARVIAGWTWPAGSRSTLTVRSWRRSRSWSTTSATSAGSCGWQPWRPSCWPSSTSKAT